MEKTFLMETEWGLLLWGLEHVATNYLTAGQVNDRKEN